MEVLISKKNDNFTINYHIDKMQVFQPKHYNSVDDDDGVSIMYDNHILLSKMFSFSSDGMHIIRKFNDNGKLLKYSIVLNNSVISVKELFLIDNAVSVVFCMQTYIILLANESVLYIAPNYLLANILQLNKIIEGIQIQYIDNNDKYLILYSNENLHTINELLQINTYDNVIGYLANYNTILILKNDDRIEFLNQTLPYFVDRKYGIIMNYDDILKDTDLTTLIHIDLGLNTIIIVLYESIIFYSNIYDNGCFRMYLQANTTFKSIKCVENNYLFHFNDNRLLIESKTMFCDDDDYNYSNVVRWLFIEGILVCIHSDNKITGIRYLLEDEEGTRYSEMYEILYLVLIDPRNFDKISNIKKSIAYFSIKNNHFLAFLNMDNELEILNIKTLEFETLDLFFIVNPELKKLPLLDYTQCSYI